MVQICNFHFLDQSFDGTAQPLHGCARQTHLRASSPLWQGLEGTRSDQASFMQNGASAMGKLVRPLCDLRKVRILVLHNIHAAKRGVPPRNNTVGARCASGSSKTPG